MLAFATHIAPRDIDSIRVQGKRWDSQVLEQVDEERLPVQLQGRFQRESRPSRGSRRVLLLPFPVPAAAATSTATFAFSETHAVSGVCHNLLLAVDIRFYRDVSHGNIENIVQVDSPVGRVSKGDVLDHDVVAVVNVKELGASLAVLK